MNYLAKFRAELKKLNANQRKAIQTIEGPLLIVAGPGTGKTQTMALRLANILYETQAQPQNLLALTFTEAAAHELKTRLANIIGPTAFGIQASTFHAFAAHLTNTFAGEFANQKVPLTELGQLKILREILAQGNFPLLRPLRAPEFYLRELPRVLATLKRENITPSAFQKFIQQAELEFAQTVRINPRTQKPFAKILAAEKKLAKLKELKIFFERYEALCLQRGLADFEELIYAVNQKLGDTQQQFLLAYLQENFWYLTVDEFQDTSGSQLAFLQAWGSFSENPNLCTVGDDDQSIFRFAGAALTNILEFHQSFPAAQIIPLNQNYRSTPAVCALAQDLIQKNTARLCNKIAGINKNLKAFQTEQGCKPALWFCEDSGSEVRALGEAIIELLRQNTPPQEIAVIYRQRVQGDALASFLQQKGIALWRADGEDALKNLRVQAVWQILRLLSNPQAVEAAAKVFFADFVQAKESVVWQFLSQTKTDFLLAAANSSHQQLQDFGKKLIHYQKILQTLSLPALLENLIADSGLSKIILAKEEIESARALTTFLEFARDFWQTNAEPSLADFLDNLQTMQTQRIALPFLTPAPKAVTLTTAHRAKGREFAHVFVMAVADEFWGGKGKRETLALPQELIQGSDTAVFDQAANLQEERRLFFVAITRAKQNLVFSVARSYAGRLVTPSRFLAEVKPELLTKKELPPTPLKNLPQLLKPEFTPDTQNFFQTLLQNFRLSPTAFNNFRTCPRRFLLANLLHLPVVRRIEDRAGLIFGSVVHVALEAYFREFKRTHQLPPIAGAFEALRQALQKEPLRQVERQRIEEDAIKALTQYLEFHQPNLLEPAEVEFNFKRHAVDCAGVPLTGKIDRIDFLAGSQMEFTFVDYKSMPPMSRAAIQGQTANSDGNSYRQLIFYALLAECDPRFFGRPVALKLSFLRPTLDRQEFREEVFSVSSNEVANLKKEVLASWQKIQQGDFPKTADQVSCQRCQFRLICERG